jgi:hypothetical protein
MLRLLEMIHSATKILHCTVRMLFNFPAGAHRKLLFRFQQSLSSSKGSGTRLPDDTRKFMESRFNTDFDNVRVHTGVAAEQMSNQVQAKAFTHGRDIYFNQG